MLGRVSRSFLIVACGLLAACGVAALLLLREADQARVRGTTVPREGAGVSDECRRQLDDLASGRWPARARRRPEVAALIAGMTTAPFVEASRAVNTLLRQPEFAEDTPLRDVQALLGRPDAKYDGPYLAYKTNGGPLELGFHDCRLTYRALTRPGSWHGTDEALAARWAKARETRQWMQWEPMTGWLWSPDWPRKQHVEVELNGGFYGAEGALSFRLPDGTECAGRWRAAFGNEPAVTSGGMLRTLGPRVMPEYRDPQMPRYQVPAPLEKWHQLGRADAACGNGRRMRFEFLSGPGESHGWGVASDDRGVLYRFLY